MRKAFPSPSFREHPCRQEEGKAIYDSHYCPSPAALSWILGEFTCICSMLQHVMERIYLPRTTRHSLCCCCWTEPVRHPRLLQMLLFSELTGTACTAGSPWRPGPAQRWGGILHLTSGTTHLLACRSRVGPGWFTSKGSNKEPLLNHWDQRTQVWPTGEKPPHLSKVLILLKF